MRKSAAPSANNIPYKRKRFSTPFTQPSSLSPKTSLVKDVESEEKPSVKKQPCQKFTKRLSSRISYVKEMIDEKPKDENMCKTVIKEQSQSKAETKDKYFTVVWCKASNKKHKVWEGDGVIVLRSDKSGLLHDENGSVLAQVSGLKASVLSELTEGSIFKMGAKEIEIQEEVSENDFMSGKYFISNANKPEKESHVSKVTKTILPSQKKTNSKCRQNLSQPSKNCTKKKLAEARHSPNDVNALVMPRPISSTETVIDVVVDPYIAIKLRPHQREGVQFMYECVMGHRSSENDNLGGVILADDMGLGKTLQCIALVWTLLKQGPYGYPAVKNVIIVTPSSLVKNWQKEFIKWLGSERITPYVADTNNRVDEFLLRVKDSVLIIGYEMFTRCKNNIEKAGFDLIICDEAHRLKNANIKASNLINSLAISKRILLTGTPIQNNLQELYSLCDLAVPGIFGSSKSFKQTFIDPIMEGEEHDCTEEQKEMSKSISQELSDLVSRICLRRTSESIQGHLPNKVEYVVFLQMTPLQKQLYEHLIGSDTVESSLQLDDQFKYLECINALRQLCNHPVILYESTRKKESEFRELRGFYPEDYSISNPFHFEDSSKVCVVKNLLLNFKEVKEKVVIVANSTKALDALEQVCKHMELSSGRLDGQTPSNIRQNVVDQFNSKHSNIMVLLLSCKAGGTGLNLTGASRLIMYDIDWNPAHDNQAMARIWREGQKRVTHIYRLVTVGGIEEKMYQRQISKQNVSGSVLDSLTSNKVRFSTEELKDLFQLHESETCCTLDLLRRNFQTSNEENSDAEELDSNRKKVTINQLLEWEHIIEVKNDPLLISGLRNSDCVSCVFRNETSKS